MEMALQNDERTILASSGIKLTFSILLLAILVLSLLGNISTCVVVIRDNSMRTPTNGYLFNLAVIDLLITLAVPVDVYIIWQPDYYPFGEVGCYMHMLIMDGLINARVMTICAFTIERYLVISKPFLRQSLAKMSRVYKIIAAIWIMSCAFCFPEVLTVELMEKKKFVYCLTTMSNSQRIYSVAVQVFLIFMVPMAMISILYTLIAIKLRSTKRSPVTGNLYREKAVRMLAAVAASFFFCWSPMTVMQVMIMMPKYRQRYYYDTWRVIHYIATVNGYMTTIVNPILYSLMSRKFRQAFKDIFRRKKTPTQSRYELKVCNT
ncbi:pyrokinin-1 receptor-like [Plutella xylostella]|uniref:pyrokinin-1 receptor-like n=1 Tax=Plutella xylostella TaxID=51655 RepID=UPI002032F1E5|nr:pyrokinin-1 receptor-like [Plutella xylostella]